MKSKLISCVVAGALGATVALTSAVQARGGGGGMGGGMHGGGMGGGMHAGGMGGGMHAGGMGGGAHFGAMGGGMRFGGNRFAGANFAGTHFVHQGFPSRSSRFAFRDHRFFRHHRFAFIGAPFLYDDYYDDCWRRTWTSYGPQWINVCGYY
jgi:hypothetical protein